MTMEPEGGADLDRPLREALGERAYEELEQLIRAIAREEASAEIAQMLDQAERSLD